MGRAMFDDERYPRLAASRGSIGLMRRPAASRARSPGPAAGPAPIMYGAAWPVSPSAPCRLRRSIGQASGRTERSKA